MAADNRTLACDLSALDDPEQHKATSVALFESYEEVEELGDGYAFRYPAAPEWTRQIAAFIQGEQQCCPFFRFELVVDPEQDATWLQFRGDAKVKAFLKDNLIAQWIESGDASGTA